MLSTWTCPLIASLADARSVTTSTLQAFRRLQVFVSLRRPFLVLVLMRAHVLLRRSPADIGECVKVLRETAEEEGVAPIPIFGNGDAYDHRTYWENVEQSGVDGIMIARGALVKPWIFTELRERRDCASIFFYRRSLH